MLTLKKQVSYVPPNKDDKFVYAKPQRGGGGKPALKPQLAIINIYSML